MVVGSNLKNSLIMMVDDEPIMLELIRIFLEEHEYEHFHGLSDSSLALQQIEEKNPDIVLLDLVMPKVNGFDILSALRRNEATKHLPVIVLTSSSDSETKLKALELGATDFLAKPVDQSELALRLRNTLSFKAYQDQLAYYDGVTGLPNKRLCIERLQKAINSIQTEDGLLAILNLKAGQYRYLVESFGPKVGDSILKGVSERLLECVRSSDIVSHGGNHDATRVTARLEGDGFSILLTRISNDGDAAFVAERVVKAFEKPLQIDNKELFLPVSIGIALYPSDGQDPNVLVNKAASAAVLLADEQTSGYTFYSEAANQHLKDKLELQQDLRKALANNELYLVYQPQVAAGSGQVKGAEALIRWAHPTRGFVSPGVFVPLAEEAGLMDEIGTFVLREACQQSKHWQAAGVDVTVSVNISGRQFRSATFLQVVESVLTDTGAKPENIMLEITESLAMANVSEARVLLNSLRALGLEISVDDFGTGYSSLSYLKNFPINELKIDKSFIDGLPDGAGDQALVSAIVTMAKKLNFKVVAEGVELAPQLDYLKALGCDLIQGYFFAKPLSVDEFSAFYHSGR